MIAFIKENWAAVAAAFWRQLVGVFGYLRSLMIEQVVLNGDAAHEVRTALLRLSQRRWLGTTRHFTSARVVFKGRQRLLFWETVPLGGTRLIFWRGRPVVASSNWLNISAHSSEIQVVLWSCRGMVDFEKLLSEVLAQVSARSAQEGFRVIRLTGSRAAAPGKLVAPQGAYSYAGLLCRVENCLNLPSTEEEQESAFFVEHQRLASLSQHFKTWLESAAWYQRRGMEWRSGWYIYGPPGSGKTALVVEQARRHNVAVFVIELGSMTDADLVDAWQAILADVPCVVLLEDVDTVFDGRVPVQKDLGLSFSTVLNTLGGASGAHGVFLVVTANDPTRVDSALVRPGRVELHAYLTGIGPDVRRQVYEKILQDWPAEIEAAEAWFDPEQDVPISAVVAKATERALELRAQTILF